MILNWVLRVNYKVTQGSDMPRAPWSSCTRICTCICTCICICICICTCIFTCICTLHLARHLKLSWAWVAKICACQNGTLGKVIPQRERGEKKYFHNKPTYVEFRKHWLAIRYNSSGYMP